MKGKRAGWNTGWSVAARFDPTTWKHPHKAYPQMSGFVGGAGGRTPLGYQETTNTYYENVARSQKLPGIEVRGWSEKPRTSAIDKAQEVYSRYARNNPNSGLTGDLLKDLAANRDNPDAVGKMSEH